MDRARRRRTASSRSTPPAGAGTSPPSNRAAEKVQSATCTSRPGWPPSSPGRGLHLHRAGAGGEPEGQVHRDDEPLRRLRRERQQLAGIQQVGQSPGEGPAPHHQRRPVPHPPLRDPRRLGDPAALAHPARPRSSSRRSSSTTPAATLGRIVQENVVGKIRFASSTPPATKYGSINAETGGPGTSTSRTTPAPRWPASPRPSPAWSRPRSPRRTTTWCRSTARSRTRCAPSWWPPPSASTPPSSRTTAGSG